MSLPNVAMSIATGEYVSVSYSPIPSMPIPHAKNGSRPWVREGRTRSGLLLGKSSAVGRSPLLVQCRRRWHRSERRTVLPRRRFRRRRYAPDRVADVVRDQQRALLVEPHADRAALGL